MKRKLFNFLSFGIFISVLLSGCRAENETVGFEGNTKQDYVNKSLWNEDEVFIKNVKKIYEKMLMKFKCIQNLALWRGITPLQ